MIYKVTINDKEYEVEVEKGKANILKTTAVTAPAAPVASVAPAPVAATPVQAPVASASTATAIANTTPVVAPMPGTILKVNVSVGQQVKEGDLIVVLEAMKMENEIYAPCDGTIAQLVVSKGSSVSTDDLLASIS